MKKRKNIFILAAVILIAVVCSLLPNQNGMAADTRPITSVTDKKPSEIIIKDYSEYKTSSPACVMPSAFTDAELNLGYNASAACSNEFRTFYKWVIEKYMTPA